MSDQKEIDRWKNYVSVRDSRITELEAKLDRYERMSEGGECMADGLEERERNMELKAKLAAAEKKHIATVLLPDPYDERDGAWFSIADNKRIAELPSGTKLYIDAAKGKYEP